MSHECQHSPTGECCTNADCNDADVCTNDTCDTGTNTCSHSSNTASCDDGSACTTGDVCSNGTCAGTTITCNDGNPCTDDSCSFSTGCVYLNNTVGCDDLNACTTPDTCSGGACAGSYVPTPGCCSIDDDCDDGTPDTVDLCTAGVCSNRPMCDVNADCDDADACTTDTCNAANAAALDLDGTNDYLTLRGEGDTTQNFLTNFGASSFTVEGWFWADSSASYGVSDNITIFRQGRQGGNPQVVVQLRGTSGLRTLDASVETSYMGGGANYTQYNTPAVTFSYNAWHHFAMVVDRASNQLHLYLDGGTPSSVSAPNWGTYPINNGCVSGTCTSSTADPVLVAATRADSGALGPYFKGRVDEIRVWDTARTQTEIQANKDREISSVPGLRHRWAMNEGAGTTAADTGSTPTSVATLVNGPAWRTSAGDIPTYGDGLCEHTPVPNCCDSASDCDDLTACTDDSCDETHHCQHTNNIAACDDGLFCNGADSCAGGYCAHAGNPCPGDQRCDEATDTCVECLVDGDCASDGNVCTDEVCNTETHACENPFNTLPCEDGNTCTTGDTCNGSGLCVGGAATSCDDGNACTQDSCLGSTIQNGLILNGTSQYVHLGAASTHTELGLSRFTIETWFKKTGSGVEAAFAAVAPNNAIPLVTKGRGVGDGGTFDLNYFLGIVNATGKVVFSFEQIETPVGGDNLVQGTVNVNDGLWHHAAVTYDGQTLRLYVDGSPDGSLATTKTPRWDSIHRFALGTGYSDYASALGPAGYFAGVLDEVRVWDHARSGSAIAQGMARRIRSAPGLVGRFGLDETSGTVAHDTTANANDGTAVSGPTWTAGTTSLGTVECVSDAAAMNGAGCDDGLFCTDPDTCSAGACAGTARNCSDGVGCTTDSCDEGADACVHTPLNAACDDGAYCNGAETCNASLGCQAGSAPNCGDAEVCTSDSCDEGTDQCVHDPVTDGTPCSDGNACTAPDSCQSGACAPGAGVTCDDSNACTNDSCDPATGCHNTPLNCFDGDSCTLDTCAAGACRAPDDRLRERDGNGRRRGRRFPDDGHG